MFDIAQFSMDWAVSHGLAIRPASNSVKGGGEDDDNRCGLAVHAPFSLFPSPFPDRHFRQAQSLQPILNTLVDRLVMDPDFLETFIEPVVQADPFVAKLFDIHRKVYSEFRDNQLVRLALMRMDYMIDCGADEVDMQSVMGEKSNEKAKLKMIEFNTIAASMGSHATNLYRLHRLTSRLRDSDGGNTMGGMLEPNDVISGMAETLYQAHVQICNAVGIAAVDGPRKPYILFVIQDGERNVFDQKNVEFALAEKYGILCLRRTLAELDVTARVDKDTQLLVIDGTMVVSVAYFRAGYSPADFPGQGQWNALFKLESSRSVCCPTTGYQLIGLKKVQEILALNPGIMEKYLDSRDECHQVAETFTGFYGMQGSGAGGGDDDGNHGDPTETLRKVLERPEGYVLKPQREGGGNNIYGRDIPAFVEKMGLLERPKDCAAYIVMDLIRPPYSPCTFVRNGRVTQCEKAVNELGIYGAFIIVTAKEDRLVIKNEAIGYLVRTKSLGTNEGGVAAGFAVIDTPRLFHIK